MPARNQLTSIQDFLVADLPASTREAFVALLELQLKGREDIVVFSEKILGMPLNEFQKNFLRHTTTPRYLWEERFGTKVDDIDGFLFGKNIACPSNQVGKTVMIAIKHLWMNYYKIGLDLDEGLIDRAYYATLNISPQSRQAKQCYNYAKDILNEQFVIDYMGKKRLNKLSPLMKEFLVGENSNLGELRFANRSIFFTVPVGHDQAGSLAGGQFGYISYDECAQSYHLQNELGAKILSRLIKYGVGLDLISTPEVDAPSHQYYFRITKLGFAGRDGWWALNATLDDNVFIPKAQRERAKADLLATDKLKYRQVVLGEFISGGKRFFDVMEIEQLWRLPSKIMCVKGHLYLLVADWGMSDTGDDSVFGVFDYTNYAESGKIQLVNHEKVKGGSPQMQFALLRTLYESYTWTRDDGTDVTPTFLMDEGGMGGVMIKKMLVALKPKSFEIEKDEALFITKREMAAGRDFVESEVDGSVTEKNKNFGNILSYYIEELSEQLGNYHVEDKKLTQDFVMMLAMGVSYIVKKMLRGGKPATLNRLASYQGNVRTMRRAVAQ